ncbi:MAG: hypothetical protein QOJ42_2513, partial [Acidobacteriaceae bacterium]|nr:hypothetical protein [Acidobacteriaceae bacterium]
VAVMGVEVMVVAATEGAEEVTPALFMGAVAFGRTPESVYSSEAQLSLPIITLPMLMLPTTTTIPQPILSSALRCNNRLTGITAPPPEPTIRMSRNAQCLGKRLCLHLVDGRRAVAL